MFYLQFYTSYDNICFSPDDSQVFVSHGKDVVVFNVLEGNKVDEFKKVYNYEVGRACFSPQGQKLIELIMVFDTSWLAFMVMHVCYNALWVPAAETANVCTLF